MRWFLRALAAMMVLGLAQAQTPPRRVALVIANAAYRNVTPLGTPGADGRLVADALAASGFDVRLGLDLDKTAMAAAIQEFGIDAATADVAVVYYAGHGLEADGRNWLVPVDAAIAGAADVPRASTPFELIARALHGAAVKIVALDACRENPFAARVEAAGGTINRGLGEVELDGYVVMYSAAAGAVARDGQTNSPFATAFAHWIGVQNVDLRLLAGSIHDDVIAATAGAQRPFTSASLPGGVTTLAPAPRGLVRAAAAVRTRAPRNFDFVRTLRDTTCTPTGDMACHTDTMFLAAGNVVTIDQDSKLRVWDAAAGRVTRADAAPSSAYLSRRGGYLPAVSKIAIGVGSTVAMIPLGAGTAVTRTVEHNDNPDILFTAGAPPVAIYAYPVHCGFGFVDLNTFARIGATRWAENCLEGEVAWTFPDPSSDRFVANVLTVNRREPYRVRELVVATYHAPAITCRIAGDFNDAAFDAGGDLYAARDDGSVTRFDHACRATRSYRPHQAAIEQLGAAGAHRMLTRSVDGAMRIWSIETGRVEREVTGLAREAEIIDYAEDGAAVLVLGDDRRLHIWSGEPRLGPYVGPAATVCGGALSTDRDTLYALRCEGNVEVWRRERLN